MEILVLPGALTFFSILALFLLLKLTFSWWVSAIQNHLKLKLKRRGFGGPPPSFPLGNIQEMKKKNSVSSSLGSSNLIHDIHSTVFPYFSRWQNSHGKVFIYWLGTEPFLYIADPEFLKKCPEVLAKRWGKPRVFRHDRDPMFGNGLVMVEGNEWVRHRHVIAPAFSPLNLKAMTRMMIESTNQMIDRWITQINSAKPEINVEREVVETAGEIIAKTSFGMKGKNAKEVSEKLRALQVTLFRTRRYLLQGNHQADGKLGKTFTIRDLLDECKTFFFAGQGATSLAISWTLLLLAMHEDWQIQLRDEIREVVGDKELDINVLAGLKKVT
ncbi:Cytochrome P450 714B1 [Spatholobus suberectus]|nr:Cytochrome P450 714B1 [Spatholobus suberectus]